MIPAPSPVAPPPNASSRVHLADDPQIGRSQRLQTTPPATNLATRPCEQTTKKLVRNASSFTRRGCNITPLYPPAWLRSGGFRMSMKPLLRTLYFPSSIWSTATVRVNTRKPASSGTSGMAFLRKSYGGRLGPVDGMVHHRVDDALRVERRDHRGPGREQRAFELLHVGPRRDGAEVDVGVVGVLAVGLHVGTELRDPLVARLRRRHRLAHDEDAVRGVAELLQRSRA